MTQLYFVTSNANKFAEVQAVLPGIKQLKADVPEIQSLDSRRIIEEKLAAVLHEHRGGVIVEDTSLSLNCLNGLPGPLIKWFLEAIGTSGITRLAKALGDPAAEARTMIGYANNPQEVHFFEGVLHGSIVEPRGDTTFGWDPIFVPEGHAKTFAEMSRAEKNSLSMRRKAVEQLRQFLEKEAG